MKSENKEELSSYISSTEWLKFINYLKGLLEIKIRDNSNEECIVIERKELDAYWPEIINNQGKHLYFAKTETIATLLDAELNILVVGQGGEKLKFYKNKVGNYETLKRYKKLSRLFIVLYLVMLFLAILWLCIGCKHPIFLLLSVLLSFTGFAAAFTGENYKRKSRKLKTIKKDLQLIQPSNNVMI